LLATREFQVTADYSFVIAGTIVIGVNGGLSYR
jgi:hypothetical protein